MWYFVLKEGHGLKVCESMVLKKVFVPKKEEVRGVWRILHTEELYNLFSPPNIIKVIKFSRM